MTELLQPGLTATAAVTVDASNTAEAMGSGSASVFATPALVALMEQAAVKALDGILPDGSTSVGVHIDVQHIAATPVGMIVTATAVLTAVEGRLLRFTVSARDEVEEVGRGLHQRFVVDAARFQARVEGKKTGD